MKQPKNVRGAEIRIVAKTKQVKIYGNPQAFKSLANWMTWLAKSKASEHYDFHLPFHLDAKGKSDFDINFMIVEKADLRKMKKA